MTATNDGFEIARRTGTARTGDVLGYRQSGGADSALWQMADGRLLKETHDEARRLVKRPESDEARQVIALAREALAIKLQTSHELTRNPLDLDAASWFILSFEGGERMYTSANWREWRRERAHAALYYDQAGLLRPRSVTGAGYRLYGDDAPDELAQILFFRELDFPSTKFSAFAPARTTTPRSPNGKGRC
jgi:hypothetical protein